MSKQEQIEELKAALAEAEVIKNKLRDRADKLEADKRADEGYAELAEQGRVAAAKLAREQEAIDLLKLGYVKVGTLRDMVSAEYAVNASPELDITKFTLRLRSTDRVENALRAAILVKPKPKFATGGYVGGGSVHGSAPLDARVASILNPDGLMFVPRQVQLSPVDRQLLSDINNSVKISVEGSDWHTGIGAKLDAVRRSADKLSEGSHRVVWGNDL